jgi:hypothetical protein
MANASSKTSYKHVVHIMLLTSMMAAGGYTLFSKSKQIRAQNNNVNTITKERLDTFYENTVAVQLAGEKESVEFFEKHLHGEFEGVMHVISKIENASMQEETIVLTKFEYLRDIKKTYETATIEELKSGIVSYDVAEDGNSAIVKDRTYTMVNIPIEKAKGEFEVYNLRQFIICDKLYVLSEEDVILLKSSSCEVEGQMSKSQAL